MNTLDKTSTKRTVVDNDGVLRGEKLRTVIEDYLEDCRLSGMTEKTRRSKKEVILDLWFTKFGGEVSQGSMRSFLLWLKDVRKIKERSQRTYMLAVKAFLRYVSTKTKIDGSWIDSVITPKAPPSRIFVIPAEKAYEVIITGRHTRKDLIEGSLENEWALIMYLDTGLRLNELINLTPENFNADCTEVEVITEKTQKIRILPIVRIELIEEIKKRMGREKIFKVSIDSLNRRLHRGSRLLGLPKNLHVHSLRHIFATDLLRNGEQLHIVSDMLGHDSVDTTSRIYKHLLNSDYRKALLRRSTLLRHYASIEEKSRGLDEAIDQYLGGNDGFTTTKKVGKHGYIKVSW